MDSTELLTEAFERIKQHVHRAVNGLSPDELSYRADVDANSIAWLVWHLARVQDDHVSELARTEQLWSSRWAARFALPFDVEETGYGQSSDEVAAVKVDSSELTGYYDDVHDATLSFVASLGVAELDRIIDTNWDPPVTVGVRLISVIDDDIQHAGQALFVRGLVERLR